MRLAVAGLLVAGFACGNNVEAPKPMVTTTTASPSTELTTTTTTEEPVTVPPTAPPESLREQATIPAVTPAAPAQVTSSTGACGGSLPPCYVMMRESRGDPTVYNYSGSGASGKWQIMPGTWAGYRGYANAADAPESVQDDKARQLWDGGNGCAHWNAC